MRPRDRALAQQLEAALFSFYRKKRSLPGIDDSTKRVVLVEQLLESIHRVRFVAVLRTRELSDRRTNPHDELFDPLKAAILHMRRGDIEEAFWLVFMFVHFGKHASAGWRYAREVYGRRGDSVRWDWVQTSADPAGFRAWLDNHQDELKRKGVPRGFGNHRKYQSLAAYSKNGTGAAVESYVKWVRQGPTHQKLMAQVCKQAGGDPKKAFQDLYISMRAVASFGRTARFDYLSMVGKLSLAPIDPGSAYLQGSTGPLQGAQMLFGSHKSPMVLDEWLQELNAQLEVGMQVLEDALCNWQKSPETFKPFRG